MLLVKLTIDPTAGESRMMTTEAYPVIRETEKQLLVRKPLYKARIHRFEIETVYFEKKRLRYVQRGKGGPYCRTCYWLTEQDDMSKIKKSMEMETAVLRIGDQIRGELQSVANTLLRIEGECG